MLARLIAFSLRNAALVTLASTLLVGLTLYALERMPVDVFPELNAPTVTVITESGGLTAEEVEQYISFPVESAINGLPDLRRVRGPGARAMAEPGDARGSHPTRPLHDAIVYSIVRFESPTA